jgi:RNA polymerase sigma factor (TIGR02999 family)
MNAMDAETPNRHEITAILEGAEGLSRQEVLRRLAPIVYDELRQLAAAQLRRERPGHTLQPTALVNEAYLRLLGAAQPPWGNRGAFFGAAAQAMHRILIDHARKRMRQKRGGGAVPVSLSRAGPTSWDEPERLLALDEALRRLVEVDARSAEVIKLRYFGGLSIAQTAEALGVSERTVKREWSFARAWLRHELGEAGEHRGE